MSDTNSSTNFLTTSAMERAKVDAPTVTLTAADFAPFSAPQRVVYVTSTQVAAADSRGAEMVVFVYGALLLAVIVFGISAMGGWVGLLSWWLRLLLRPIRWALRRLSTSARARKQRDASWAEFERDLNDTVEALEAGETKLRGYRVTDKRVGRNAFDPETGERL